jgi:hypothetical protein
VVFAGYFLSILLYCLVPIIRQRAAFSQLTLLNQGTRIGFAIALSMKVAGDIALNVISHVAWQSADDHAQLYGAFLSELPCYINMSCYSLVLIFWLSVCTQILPMLYIRTLQGMKRILIGFNMLAYLLFVGIVVIALDVFTPIKKHNNLVLGSVAIGRDFLLAVIFIVFLIMLRLGLTDDASVGYSIDERKMFGFTVLLSLFLVLRGGLTLAQALIFSDGASECNNVFFALLMVNEVICEGVPFILLIRSNNQFLDTVETDTRSALGERLSIPDVLVERDL